MAGEYQRILLCAPAVGNLIVVFDFDSVHAPVDKIDDGQPVRRILVVFFGNSVELVGHFVRADVARFAWFGKITVESWNGR